ncbi:hypothetical protein ABB29_14230 [Pseudoxanthomonas dokdonensis]|uniref:VCBS repeat-containing protein n=2 Tax=Pseudoxanthomonas dokdonensis TaxID=344882 RepID=A0A0R0CGJ7_9GAMM|nr:hypothetical protein ABB29_14230 [Pseudoxanthomonas dokdonensis]
MSGPNKYTTFLHQIATALNKTGYDNEWTFDGADYNNDGVRDLIAIDKQGSSGKVDIHVLDGATNYQTFLLHKATAQAAVDADLSWNFGMGDFNKDGHLDLYCIRKNGTTGYTEVHILDGSNSFASYLLHKATPLGSTGSDDSWSFRVADYDGDGVDDVYAIKKNQGTQIHVLDGATSFTTYSLRTNTPFGSMGSDQAWVADIADYNADGYPDAYFVLRESSGNKTAVHILDGKSQYQDFLLRTNTALAGTGVDGSWSFVVSQ